MINRLIVRTLLALILLLGIGLRLNGITSKSLWLDEALSWKLQTFPVSKIIERSGEPTTTHPPLYFLILHGWTKQVGDSEIALRSLSLIFGIGTLLAMFFLLESLRRLTSASDGSNDLKTTTAGILACLFLAVSNLHIHQSQQVRGYTLATFLTVLSSVFLILGLTQPKKCWQIWGLYIISVTALIYTHNLGLFSMIAQWVFACLYLWISGRARKTAIDQCKSPEPIVGESNPVLVRGDQSNDFTGSSDYYNHRLRNAKILFVISAIIITAAYVPWLSRSLGQSAKLQSSWTKPLLTETIPIEIEQAVTGTSTELVTRPTVSSWCFLAGLLLLGLSLVIVCEWPGFFLFVMGAVPLLLIYGYSLYSERSIFDARYLMFAQQFWLAGAAWLFSRIPALPERIVLASIPTSWCIFWCLNVQSQQAMNSQPGMRAAVAKIENHYQSTEIVVAETPFVFFGAEYYARNTFPVRVCAEAKNRFLLNGESQLLSTDLVTPSEIEESNPTGIWVLSSASYMSVAKSQFPTDCVVPPEHWEQIERFNFEQDVYWEHPVEIRHYLRQDR